jgi:hypothetical protein
MKAANIALFLPTFLVSHWHKVMIYFYIDKKDMRDFYKNRMEKQISKD